MAETILNVLCVVLSFAAFLLSASFCYRYYKHRWRSLEAGRYLMYSTLLVAVVMLYATFNSVAIAVDDLNQTDGDYPGRRVFAIVIYAVLCFTLRHQHQMLSDSDHE